jgi:hypothetical protein
MPHQWPIRWRGATSDANSRCQPGERRRCTRRSRTVGPNNMLFDPGPFAATAVLDWEWAHPDDPRRPVSHSSVRSPPTGQLVELMHAERGRLHPAPAGLSRFPAVLDSVDRLRIRDVRHDLLAPTSPPNSNSSQHGLGHHGSQITPEPALQAVGWLVDELLAVQVLIVRLRRRAGGRCTLAARHRAPLAARHRAATLVAWLR